MRASFLFVGDLNDDHQKWLVYTAMIAAFNFATVSGCDQLVASPIHARGGTLDLLMTDDADENPVAVVIYLCRMCQRVLLVVLWLLMGARLRPLTVEILSTTEPLCPSQCLFGTILVAVYLMV